MKTSTALRKLIRACVDDERTLRHESHFVSAGRAEALRRLAGERKEFVEDLVRLAGGAPPDPSGSWTERLGEMGHSVWVAAAGRNSGDAIRVCRHSRARTEALYDEAMQTQWPEDVQRVLAAQCGRIHFDAEELNRLRF
jgi:hypothetical protein